MVGQQTREFEHRVDARWLMAYAAGIHDGNPRYMDTSAGNVIGHPVFPVCLEWPVILCSRELRWYESVSEEESRRGVHAAHDLHIYKPIVAGETYRTKGRIVSLKMMKPGAAQTILLETRDSKGELVCRTWQLGISRGVGITGDAVCETAAPAPPEFTDAEAVSASWEIGVQEGAANVYTETARIFNPIHSDRAVALAAGLPDIILHGTATLAMGITRLVNEILDGDPLRVTRLGGRFTGMVLMPSTLKLVLGSRRTDAVSFEMYGPDGTAVLERGFLCFHPAS